MQIHRSIWQKWISAIKNRQRNGYFHNTILTSWLISYICILCIPLIGSFAVNSYIRQKAQEEIIQSNISQLENVREGVDRFFFMKEGEMRTF